MEIEAKFALTGSKPFKALCSVGELAGYEMGAVREESVRDTYLDTADRTIQRAGFVCRRREGDGRILMTLKELRPAAEAIHRREEFELVLEADRPPAEWSPGPAKDLLTGLIGESRLVPLFDLRQTRLIRQMSLSGRPVAMMSLDRVRLAKARRTLSFRELEVELASAGREEDLAAIVSCLRGEWKLKPEPRSKYERGIEFADGMSRTKPPSPPEKGAAERPAATRQSSGPGIKPNDPMAEAARKVLLLHFRRMADHEPGTREGSDPEELHDMRVATRRLRSALRVFCGDLDGDAIKPFAKSLRRTGRLLGAVRDLDVFGSTTQLYIDRLPAERKTELDPFWLVYRAEYARAREALLSRLKTGDHKLFMERFGEFLRRPRAPARRRTAKSGEPLPFRVRHVMPRILFDSASRVQAYGEWMTGPDVPLARFHQLRIACKRLRYALEFFREVLEPEAGRLIEDLKKVQDHLGNLQDAVVACQALRSYLLWGSWVVDKPVKKSVAANVVIAPGVAAYLAVRQKETAERIEAFPAVWRPLAGKRLIRRLSALVTV